MYRPFGRNGHSLDDLPHAPPAGAAGKYTGNALGNPATTAAVGLIALAAAMGIGRFVFTPIMPVMEADAGLSLKAAGWLAAANYLGYLLGALCAARLTLTQGVRGGLLLTAVVTFAMGLTHALVPQLVLRLLAGVASAWVMVHVSAWALNRLLALDRADANGVVYAGVGVGVGVTGLICMMTMQIQLDSDHTWQLFGVLAFVIALALWRSFRGGKPRDAGTRSKTAAPRVHWNADKWRLMWCYGVLGFGYIIPATYLPDMAHHYITDPLLFGLAWPVFGAASALSTWIAARWLGRIDDRRLWGVSHVLMAIGVALPVFWPSLGAVLIAALLVGGTYMVGTMLALRESRRAAGVDATPFIAVMTVAFALGQIVGPLLVSGVAQLNHGFAAALLAAAIVLLLSAASLWRSAGRRNKRIDAKRHKPVHATRTP